MYTCTVGLFLLLILFVNGDGEGMGGSDTGGIRARTQDNKEVILGGDNSEHVYCLSVESLYEASSFDTDCTSEEYGDKEDIDDSEIKFGSKNADEIALTFEKLEDAKFTLSNNGSTGSRWTDLIFTFEITEIEQEWGLKYTMDLDGYEWINDDATTKLVIKMELKECTVEYKADFEDDKKASEEEEAAEKAEESQEAEKEAEDEENDDDRRRRLEDDDECDRILLAGAQFTNNEDAKCDGDGTIIGSGIYYDDDGKELDVVYDHFNCDLFHDPGVTLEDDASYGVMLSVQWSVGGLVGMMLILWLN